MELITRFVFLVTLSLLYGGSECSWRPNGGPGFWPQTKPFGRYPDYLNTAASQDSASFGLPPGPPSFAAPGYLPPFHDLDLTPSWGKPDWDVPLEPPLYTSNVNNDDYQSTGNDPKPCNENPTTSKPQPATIIAITIPKRPLGSTSTESPPTLTTTSTTPFTPKSSLWPTISTSPPETSINSNENPYNWQWQSSNWGTLPPNPAYPPVLVVPVETCLRLCPVTSEYNPVCGTNDITYTNPGRLLCARQCGVDVQIKRESDCSVPAGGSVQTTAPPLSKGLTASPAVVTFCMKMCRINPDFQPVCGTNYVTYFNIERLQCAQKCGEAADLLCSSACDTYDCRASLSTTVKAPSDLAKAFEVCSQSCSVTTEYNPVCGSNNITYDNPSMLLCSQFCGIDVKVQKFSACSTTVKPRQNTPQMTKEACSNICRTTSKKYSPVCGSNNITYTSSEELVCAKNCGFNVELTRDGSCQPQAIDTISTTTVSYNTTPSVTEMTIKQSILDEIFGTNHSTSPLTPTTDIDESIELNPRFLGQKEPDENRIVFRE